jgi:type II secretory pathway pseudopilin PulG
LLIVRPRAGLSLGEVIVALALTALLATAVMPTVFRQLERGDSGQIAGDVASLRVAVEEYSEDVRKYPATFGQVSRAITIADKDLVFDVVYSPQVVSRWRGPYTMRDSVRLRSTGNGWQFDGKFYKDTLAGTGASIVWSVGIRVTSADSATVLKLDQAIDDGVLSTGVVRYETVPAAPRAGKLKILLVQIR